MNQKERYHVLQLLEKASKEEVFTLDLLKEIKECEVVYDFFEDLFEILYEYPYNEHLVYVRVSALFDQIDEDTIKIDNENHNNI